MASLSDLLTPQAMGIDPNAPSTLTGWGGGNLTGRLTAAQLAALQAGQNVDLGGGYYARQGGNLFSPTGYYDDSGYHDPSGESSAGIQINSVDPAMQKQGGFYYNGAVNPDGSFSGVRENVQDDGIGSFIGDTFHDLAPVAGMVLAGTGLGQGLAALTSGATAAGAGSLAGSGGFGVVDPAVASGGAIASPVTAGVANGVDLGPLGAGGAASGAGGGGLAGETLSKAALDGTTAFGANSVPGAYSLAGGAAAGGAAAGGAGGSFLSGSLAGIPMSSLLPAGATLASGLIGAAAANKAANTQAAAGQNALNLQRDMFNTQVGLEAPFRQAGLDASQELKYGLGLSTDGGPGAGAAGIGYGSMVKPFSMSDFQLDPGIQFQMQQGNLALQNSQAAKDGVLSGGALKDLIGYNQQMAGTGYQSAYERYITNQQNQYDRLMGLTNLGQSAASNTANNASTMAGTIGNTMTGIGNAQASGTVGTANALSSGLTGAGNYLMLNSLLSRLPQPTSSATPTASI